MQGALWLFNLAGQNTAHNHGFFGSQRCFQNYRRGYSLVLLNRTKAFNIQKYSILDLAHIPKKQGSNSSNKRNN